jgi:hypothetical protein
MKMRDFIPLAVFPAVALLAQSPPTPPASAFAAAVDEEVAQLEKQFVALAEAMPPEKFDFSPGSLRIPGSDLGGVRTYALQVRHVAADNFAIWAPISGKPEPAGIDAPNGPAGMTSRAEILDFLKRSFVFGHEAARRLTAENAAELVDFRGRRVTRLSLVVLAFSHAMDHYGQMVEYLRLSGTAPPGSRPRPQSDRERTPVPMPAEDEPILDAALGAPVAAGARTKP